MGSSELAAPGELSSRCRPGTGRYDVFMSFRGEDTHLNFTDHLYAALIRRGIVAFRDDIKLQRGDPVLENLFRAIEESRIFIIAFSVNSASSTSCLDEMEKIYDCMRSKGPQTVLPFFYYLDPSDVRKQTGGFEEAFAEHESAYGKNSEKVLKWRKAMTGVANLLGWHLQNK